MPLAISARASPATKPPVPGIAAVATCRADNDSCKLRNTKKHFGSAAAMQIHMQFIRTSPENAKAQRSRDEYIIEHRARMDRPRR